MQKTMAESEIIPADLYEEFLYLLPSNDLLNFKRVCRDWNELITSQRFIQKHLERSKADCDGTLIVALSPSEITVCGGSAAPQTRRSLSYPLDFSIDNSTVMSCGDGLVCLIGLHSHDFAIINPSTGESSLCATAGPAFGPQRGYWFGRHPSTGEYLFVLLTIWSATVVQVHQFSSGKKYRRSSQSTSVPTTALNSSPKKIPILLHGALHWPARRQTGHEVVVLAYDIQEDKLGEISTPFNPDARIALGTVGGCLCAITGSHGRFKLWIMKEYGVEESWTKYCDIEGFLGCWELSPLGFLRDGDLLLNVDNGRIVKYSFRDKTGTLLHVYRDDRGLDPGDSRAVLCADSLVSPSQIWRNSFVLENLFT